MLVDQKRIPEIPIWVDSPMAINATAIFQIHPECYDQETHEAFVKHHENPFGFNSLHFASSVQDSKRLNDLQGPAVIISADGMCEAGRIQHHLIHHISDPSSTILIVGYMAANTAIFGPHPRRAVPASCRNAPAATSTITRDASAAIRAPRLRAPAMPKTIQLTAPNAGTRYHTMVRRPADSAGTCFPSATIASTSACPRNPLPAPRAIQCRNADPTSSAPPTR